MTLKQIYRQAIILLKRAKISTAELDARVIIKFVLKISTEQFYLDQNREISPTKLTKIEKLINRRLQNEPVAYLTGKKEFFGRDFYVSKDVLIPRPETEWLVEKSINYLEKKIKDKKQAKILDMGTGSGNIIISIIKQLSFKMTKQHDFYATDVSNSALKMARKNAQQYEIENINFIKSDLFSALNKKLKFDLIIANLPYVPKDKITANELRYEPANAIFASDNGSAIIKQFLQSAETYLNRNSLILLELDPRNAMEIQNFAKEKYPQAKIELIKDLTGWDRYLEINL